MKNQKRRKMGKFRGLCIFVLGIIVISIKWNGMGIEFGKTVMREIAESMGTESKEYQIGKPQVLEDEEIEVQLKELAEEYEAFTEVYEQRENYPKDMLAALCNNPEMIDFVKGYSQSEQRTNGKITQEELEKKVPLFLQWDKRWGYGSYGNSIIGMSGCAPTCLSMVIVGLTGNTDATPARVAEFAEENGYYIEGTGTSWSLMTKGCQNFGVMGREICLDKDIIYRELEQGHPVICSVRAGDFTTQGHFVVLVGVEDGNIQVNDPNSTYRSKQTWEYERLQGQIKNLWAFSL